MTLATKTNILSTNLDTRFCWLCADFGETGTILSNEHHRSGSSGRQQHDRTVIGSLTRSTQPHILMYMFFPYIISTLYQLLEESQM
jgi:hypothetical protein